MGAYNFDTKPFADLISDDKIGVVTATFEIILFKSFATDASRIAQITGKPAQPKITMSEVRRRFEIISTWFKTLRGDMGFSLRRTLDELPLALRKTLDGEVYTPSKRAMWTPH